MYLTILVTSAQVAAEKTKGKECGSGLSSQLWGEALHGGFFIFMTNITAAKFRTNTYTVL